MKKYSPDTLLAWASSFEDKTQYLISDRMWALTVMATAVPGRELPLQFMYDIQHLIGNQSSDEEFAKEFANWLDANKTVLEGFPFQQWNIDYGYLWTNIKHNTKAVIAVITKTSAPPNPEFEASTNAVLTASGSIPPLWLQTGRYTNIRNYDPATVLGPGLAHEEWLVEGLRKLMYRATQDQVKDFLKENQKTIDRIRKSFYTSKPKYLGGGADGVAFDIGEGKILKLFRDVQSYQKALEAYHRLHQKHPTAKTEAMIYDVGVLGEFLKYHDDPSSGVDIYYYIMEKMKPLKDFFGEWRDIPLPHILEAVATEIYRDDKWKKLKETFNQPGKGRLVRQLVRDEARKLATHFMQKSNLRRNVQEMEQKVPGLKDNWLELYIEEVIIKYITGRTDLHMGNIGVTNYGELRYYDPTYGTRSEINV